VRTCPRSWPAAWSAPSPNPSKWNGRRAPLGASIGLCFYPNDASDPADLLRLADAAMYQAKAAGKNRWQRAKPLADDA
jgi:GGDEF domain-containing protein